MKETGKTYVEKLVSISSEPLSADPPGPATFLNTDALGSELLRMLERKNGFYVFESALHVFALTANLAPGMSMQEWNAGSLWREGYANLGDGLLFFAEDALQDQFCVSSTGVVRFNAETGERHFIADSIERWAQIIMRDYEHETRWPLLHEWQEQNGRLTPGKRLLPKIPFFLGGEYKLENLWAGDAVEGMRVKADIAMQTRHLPDGSKVKLTVGEKPQTK
jgi:hypothetical protein